MKTKFHFLCFFIRDCAHWAKTEMTRVHDW